MLVPLKALGAFTYDRRDLRPGHLFEASEKDAFLLVQIGQAERYSTREMTLQKGDAEQMFTRSVRDLQIESMSLDELRALAANMGVKFHHRTGAVKLRALLTK